MKRRPLTAEEKWLWKYVTRHDIPLHEMPDDGKADDECQRLDADEKTTR